MRNRARRPGGPLNGRLLMLFLCSILGGGGCGPERAELPWLADFSAAQVQARQQARPLLIEFTGSDWCPPCKQLKARILETRVFADYASSNLVLLEVDFPRWKPQSETQKQVNQELQSKFLVEGYPTLVLLGPDGQTWGRQVGLPVTKAVELIAWIEDQRLSASRAPAASPGP